MKEVGQQFSYVERPNFGGHQLLGGRELLAELQLPRCQLGDQKLPAYSMRLVPTPVSKNQPER